METRLKKNQPIFNKLRNDVRKLEKDGDSSDVSLELNFYYGVFRQAAWQTAIITQAVRYLEFQVVQDLSVIYEIQELLRTHQQNLLKNLNSPELYSGEIKSILQYLQTILQDINTLNQIETDLLSFYKKFLNSPKTNL